MSFISRLFRHWFPCHVQNVFNQYQYEYENKPIPVKKEGKHDSDLKEVVFETSEIDFEVSSNIKVVFRVGKSECDTSATILVVSYSGNYKIGCQGNDDAEYMVLIRDFGISMSSADAVIIDFRELNYVWGDMIECVFCFGTTDFPVACVLGDGCREAIGTLVHDNVNSTEPATTVEEIFDDFDEAWQYIDELLTKKKESLALTGRR